MNFLKKLVLCLLSLLIAGTPVTAHTGLFSMAVPSITRLKAKLVDNYYFLTALGLCAVAGGVYWYLYGPTKPDDYSSSSDSYEEESDSSQEEGASLSGLQPQSSKQAKQQLAQAIAESLLTAGNRLDEASTVLLGTKSLPGQERAYDKVCIKQVAVAQQSTANGGSESCGYHAVKNGIALGNYCLLKDKARIEDLTFCLSDSLCINDLFGPKGGWRTIVQQNRARKELDLKSDMLKKEEIELLIDHEGKQEQSGLLHDSHITIIEDKDDLARMYDREWVTDDFYNQIKQVQESIQTGDFTHIFIVGTMDKARGLQGHWFTVVLRAKPGKTHEYIVADSLGMCRLDDPVVLALINTLEA